VPDLISAGNEWFDKICEFAESKGYRHVDDLYNGHDVLDEFSVKNISKYEGVNGFFYASVHSPKYYKEGIFHAVVCNKNLEIVHDPNPENKGIDFYPYANNIGYNGIRQIWIFEKI
jgi:hypothetical protein